MTSTIEEQILGYLSILGEDAERIREEYDSYGDVEVDSLQLLIVTGYLSADLNIEISAAQIDRDVKRSFRNFCSMVTTLRNAQGDKNGN